MTCLKLFLWLLSQFLMWIGVTLGQAGVAIADWLDPDGAEDQ